MFSDGSERDRGRRGVLPASRRVRIERAAARWCWVTHRLAPLESVWGERRSLPDGGAGGASRTAGMQRSAGVQLEVSGVPVPPEKPQRPEPRFVAQAVSARVRRSPGRGALRPGRTGTPRTGGGTDARSGMQAGRMAPSAVELPGARAKRVSVGASDQRERGKEDGRECWRCCGGQRDRVFAERAERAMALRHHAARRSWSFLNHASSLRRRRRASGVHCSSGRSSVRRWNQRRN